MGMQRTALSADKIAAILKLEFSLSAFPIYRCAAADAQTGVRQNHELVQGGDYDYE
jgi:hypothetical protein